MERFTKASNACLGKGQRERRQKRQSIALIDSRSLIRDVLAHPISRPTCGAIVLTDIVMPERDGYQIMEVMHRKCGIQALALTAKAMKGDREKMPQGRRFRRSHQTGHCRAASVWCTVRRV